MVVEAHRKSHNIVSVIFKSAITFQFLVSKRSSGPPTGSNKNSFILVLRRGVLYKKKGIYFW